MYGPEITYNTDQTRLAEVLASIERSGQYYAEGRLTAPPPRMSVGSVGTIAFPILPFQVRALVEAAQRAPYGRGPDTIIDTSVRDCWQIDAGAVRFPGHRWEETLASVLKSVAEGLGLPVDGVSARLYKLLVYEKGGFFAEHRDTEKADGMVATLVISLPVDGEGGELVIQHRNRETVVDLCVQEPGDLAFAAFYADCVHRTEPVRSGNRVSLVYNVIVKSGSFPASAPDEFAQAEEAGRILSDWAASEDSTSKLVWFLDHDYSEAGLSFDALKGMDAAVARTLSKAAETSRCALHLAVVDISEDGIPDYEDLNDHKWGGDPNREVMMQEVSWGEYALRGWVAAEGNERPDYGAIPICDGEALPDGALDGIEPLHQSLTEATGNAGVSIERSYRWAALVIWPKDRALRVLADGGIGGALEYAARRIERAENGGATSGLALGLVAQLIDAWRPAGRGWVPGSLSDELRANTLRMMDLLAEVGDEEQTARFLETVIPVQYDPSLNDAVVSAAAGIEPARLQSFVPALVANYVEKRFGGMLRLLLRLDNAQSGRESPAWLDLRRSGAKAAFDALPKLLADPPDDSYARWRATPRQFEPGEIRDVLLLLHRCGLAREAAEAAALIERHPRAVDPCRALPAALADLRREARDLLETRPLVALWRRASDRLVARSAAPPPGPENKRVETPLDCTCEHCRRINAFCLDPRASSLRYPVRQETRRHLRDQIQHVGIPLKCETERRGRPYTLICRKTAAVHTNRIERYRSDIDGMRLLVGAAPNIDAADVARTLAALNRAVARSR